MKIPIRTLSNSRPILKGSVSNFFSKSVTSKIIKLEKMGKIEELIGADELLEELKIELNQMLDELYAFCPPKDEQEHKKAA